jgi:hypothetical protein
LRSKASTIFSGEVLATITEVADREFREPATALKEELKKFENAETLQPDENGGWSAKTRSPERNWKRENRSQAAIE